MNEKFVQMHALRYVPPSCANRDDLGNHKTAIVGNTERLRWSSQCQKRALRTSRIFYDKLPSGELGTRTKNIGAVICEKLIEEEDQDPVKSYVVSAVLSHAIENGKENLNTNDMDELRENAEEFMENGFNGFENVPDDLANDQLIFFHGGEIEDAFDWALNNIDEFNSGGLKGATSEDIHKEIMGTDEISPDVALFGRMMTSVPESSLDGVVQMAHAVSTTATETEEDYFSAVEEANFRGDNGSGHLGHRSFGQGVLYQYVCVDRELLVERFGGDEDKADATIKAFAHALFNVVPDGMKTSYGKSSKAFYGRIEATDEEPNSLHLAFLSPVESDEPALDSIDLLEKQADVFDLKARESTFSTHHKSKRGSVKEAVDSIV